MSCGVPERFLIETMTTSEPKPRKRRRVVWVDPEAQKRLRPGESPWVEPHFSDSDDKPESSNDERLRRDKPPHW